MSVSQLRTPRTKALAYRIWAYGEPRGWDCDTVEIAEALGESEKTVRQVCVVAGWNTRLRTSVTSDGSRNRGDKTGAYFGPMQIASDIRASVAELDE